MSRPVLTGDARSTPREAVAWLARVATGAQFVDCRTFDISRGGVGILSADGFADGAVLLLALQVPTARGAAERRIVAAKAKVVFQVMSAGQYRTGFEWVAAGDNLLAALAPWTQQSRP